MKKNINPYKKRKKHFLMAKHHKKMFKWKNNIIFWIMLFLLFFLGFIYAIIVMVLYSKLIIPLPDVKWIKNIPISQSSIIYDRNGWELYKIYSENRTYVKFEDINKNMINAIVAWEDKRFWDHPWFDAIWIFRAIMNWLNNWNDFSWTSGITQQLSRITYLSNERTLERKFKELYLSLKLNTLFSKKYILELYLNKIFFWWNSYWVEQASRTLFGLKSSELWILESSILASLPKAPTLLSPYSNKWNLLWYPIIVNKFDAFYKKEILSSSEFEKNIPQMNELKSFIEKLKFYKTNDIIKICWIEKTHFKSLSIFIDKNGCTNLWYNDLLTFLNSIYIQWDKNIIEYKTWRKDYILGRMLEDWYITSLEYKEAIISSFWFDFKEYTDKIKYPYFVMYVKDYLAQKYGEDLLKTGGLKVYTTIDPSLQDKAEELIRTQVEKNTKEFNAKNAALISLNSKTSEILTMVWWVDYFDTKNLWYNNMIISRLQPGSSFKPFIYILAMNNMNYTEKTIIIDNKVTFPWWYSPNNIDWNFLWRMTLSKALNYSRNIPAIKLYYVAGTELEIIINLTKFWLNSLSDFKKEYKKKYWINYLYSAPMALWTVQITPLELAWAYSVFANNWVKNEIKPILKIIDSNWIILEDSIEWNNNFWKRILKQQMAYTMNSILSNDKDRPVAWNKYLTIPWRKLAAKTWTSSIQYLSDKWIKSSKGKWYRKTIVAPRNLWTVWYTPQITTVVWAWNTSWEELTWKAYWLTWAGPVMRDFMEFAHKNLEVEDWTYSK